tara:strand:+ start:1789 stop:2097 length:309 start_codon:yes stop_codon:yes gene_type:complete
MTAATKQRPADVSTEQSAPALKAVDNNAPPVEDVVCYFGICSDGFDQLAAILRSIRDAAKAGHPVSPEHIASLADAGYYIAADSSNRSDCWREEVQTHGVRP